MHCSIARCWGHIVLLWAMAAWSGLTATAAEAPDCSGAASVRCYFSFQPSDVHGSLHYYASKAPASDMALPTPAPVAALIVLHGHPRDANKTFDAALLAVKQAAAIDEILVVAPVFQVDSRQARRCQTAGVPAAQAGDLLWTCSSWVEGTATAGNDRQNMSSFTAMDALVLEVTRRWPSLKTITIAGFSAGAQMVQHYIAFAAPLPSGGPAVRYVVADPGTWLYFDPVRPQAIRSGVAVGWESCSGGAGGMGDCTLAFDLADEVACPAVNRWKYGTQVLPSSLSTSPALLRSRYAEADIHYLEGGLDDSAAAGAFYGILDKSCAAQAQGPYRLQRGLAYAQYDRTLLAPAKQRKVTLVPGCAHDVTCVFASTGARAALLGPGY